MLNQKKLDTKILDSLPKSMHKSGTTNSGGNFYVGKNIHIISAVETDSNNRILIPFQAGTGGDIYLKALDWNANTYSPVVNGAVSIDILYYNK